MIDSPVPYTDFHNCIAGFFDPLAERRSPRFLLRFAGFFIDVRFNGLIDLRFQLYLVDMKRVDRKEIEY